MIRVFGLIVLLVFLKPSLSHALCVTSAKANLRAAPSATSQLLWTVGKYMPLLEVGRKGAWYKVKDVDGKIAWIFRDLVSSRIDCAVIRVSSSILRNGPGKRFPKTPLGRAFKYSPFKKIERDGGWLKLQDDYGKKHWVFENNIWEALEYSRLSY